MPYPTDRPLPDLSTPYHSSESGSTDNSGLDLRSAFHALRRRIWLVVALTALATGVAAYWASRQAPLYRANATLRVKNDRQALAGALGSNPSDVFEGMRTDPILSRIQILKSRAVLGEVAAKTGLQFVPVGGSAEGLRVANGYAAAEATGDTLSLTFADEVVELAFQGRRVTSAYGLPLDIGKVRLTVPARPSVKSAALLIIPFDAAIDRLRSGVQAQPRERTDIIDISFAAGSAERAQYIVNTIAETFLATTLRSGQEASKRRREFLQDQVTVAESTLRVAQDQLSEFRLATQSFSASARYSAQQSGLMTVEVNIAELEADRATYQTLLDRLRELHQRRDVRNARSSLMTLVASPGINENPVVQRLYGRLIEFETTRDTITAGVWGTAASSPAVIRLDTLIAETRGQLVDAVQSHVSVLDARIRSLSSLRDRTAAELAVLPSTQAREDRLLFEVQSIRSLAGDLRTEFQKARITEEVSTGDIEIVDLAALPSKPLNSRRIITILLGFAIGIFGGSALALALESIGTSIRHDGDVLSKLQLRTLAIIPAMNGKGVAQGLLARMSRVGFPQRDAKRIDGAVEVRHALPPGSRSIDAFSETNSATAEAYRTLRTNLMFSQVQRQVKTVVVTSTAAGEGKTTTASNLAVALARQGLKVLVVDCDMRRPRLHEAFSVTREPGFTQLLLGVVPRSTAVRTTSVENLSVLPCGAIPPNPSELLSAPKTRELLSQLEQDFDTVILDTPPMLASADAAVLAARVDGVLLVVRAGSTDSGAARHAIDQLRFVGANILGAVLNDPDGNLPGYGKYHYYYSNYATAEA